MYSRNWMFGCIRYCAFLMFFVITQVSFLTIARTRLHKFRKNVISFPQDLPTWVQRMGLMRSSVRDIIRVVRSLSMGLSSLVGTVVHMCCQSSMAGWITTMPRGWMQAAVL